MSGSAGANLPINIRLNGTAEAEAAFNRVGQTAGTAMQRVQGATDQASTSTRSFGNVLGQAGFQVQDFATQVSMGQNALMAFGVQGAQLAGIFGTGGAIAGAGLMLGVIAAQLLLVGDNAQEAARRAEAAFEGVKRETEELADVTEKINDLYLTQEERVRRVAAAARDALATMTGLQQSSLAMQLNSLTTELPGAQADIARLQREADIERQLQERARRSGGLVPQDNGTDVQSRLFTAQSRLMGLQQEIARVDALLERANRNAQDLADNLPIPPPEAAPEADRARASVERLTEAQREYQQIMREAEGQITRTLSEEERRANTLDRLSQMLAEGAISGDQYVAAVETQRRAVEALRQQEEARAVERASAEAERRAQQAALTIERQNQQTTDNIVRYGADRFADFFADNSRGWAGMLENFRTTARSIFARIAAEAVIRPIIAPIVQGLGLGQFGTPGGFNLGNLFSLGGNALGGPAAVADAGSTQGAVTQAGQALALRQAGGFGNLGNAFMNQGMANTGYGWLDGALNYSLMNAPNTSGFATGTALAGEAGAFAGGGGAAAQGGLTVAGAIGGAAGIAGGAYGIYSGLQRGGLGGYTTAAGGLLSAGMGAAMLAGMSVPGIGWAIAAGLAIAGALMPGQQPSGRGQLSRINLDSANQTFEGLGGDRFSAGNRDAATNTVNSIADMARQIGDRLGGARIGGDIAVGVTSGRGSGPGTLYLQIGANTQQFANDEAGSKALADAAAALILQEFRTQGRAQGDYAGILAASGTVEQLSQNLEWYEKTYKVLTQATEPVSAFQQSLDQLAAQFEPAIAKARELGLSVDAMTQAREREIAKLEEQKALQLSTFATNLDVRRLRAQGNTEAADFLAFDLQADAERRSARESLQALGVTGDALAERMLWVEATLADERLAIQRNYAEQALAEQQRTQAEAQRIAEQAASAQIDSARTILDYLNNQALGASSSLSPTARLAEAERQFSAALSGGDARALTSAADALLTNSQTVFGGATAQYAQREAFVRQTLLNRGQSALTGDGTVQALSQMTAALTAQLATLQASFDALAAEQRRQNNQTLLVPAA